MSSDSAANRRLFFLLVVTVYVADLAGKLVRGQCAEWMEVRLC